MAKARRRGRPETAVLAPAGRALKFRALIGEFFIEQLPMIVVVTALGFGAAWLQYGFIPNGDRPYAIAGVSIAIWHLVWMGIWTGYTMA